MDNAAISRAFASIGTAQIADAALRKKVSLRVAPYGLVAVVPGSRLAGRALPVRHFGSVDVFLEAMQSADAGDVLVIDNGGRTGEGCIGDLTVLEARAARLAGIVLWGTHRDSAQLKHIGLPLFSYGTCLAGPQRLDPRTPDALQNARFGSLEVNRNDFVFADDDGCVFVADNAVTEVLKAAAAIGQTEVLQAEKIANGERLASQLKVAEYLARRSADATYTFRKHLREIGGAIEE